MNGSARGGAAARRDKRAYPLVLAQKKAKSTVEGGGLGMHWQAGEPSGMVSASLAVGLRSGNHGNPYKRL